MRRLFLLLAICLAVVPSEAAENFTIASTHPNSHAVINEVFPRPLSSSPPQLVTTYLYWYARAPMPVIRFNSIDLPGQLIGALPGCNTGGTDEYAYVADVSQLVGDAYVETSSGLLVALLVSIVPDPARDVILFNGTVPIIESMETRASHETLNALRVLNRASIDLLLAPRGDALITEMVTVGDHFWTGNSLVPIGQWVSHTDYDTHAGSQKTSHSIRYVVGRGTPDCVNAFGLLVTLSSESADPLIAEAGPDQNVECSGGSANVILDGSGSSDEAQDYDWYEGDTLLGSGEVLPASFDFGTHSVRLVVASGKSFAEDTVTITVQDTTPPSFTAPDDVTLYTGANSCGAFLLQKTELVIDSCSGKVQVEISGVPANNIYPVGHTTLTWTATDEAGNTATDTQIVTVVDDAPPLLKCAPPLSADTAPGQCLAAVDFPGAVTDNCPGVTLTSSPGSGSWFPPGATTVNVIATDAAGNTASCAFEVTVRDIEPPSIFAPINIQANTNSGMCTAAVCPGVPVFNDNCPGTTLTSARGDGLALNAPFTRGTTLLTWTATDRSGNTAVANQNVRVTDDQAPVISGLSVDKPQLSPPNGSMVDVMVNYQILENCGGSKTTLSVTSNEPPGNEPDWEIVNPHHVRLRAERDPGGTGRVYTITVESHDPDNHTTIQSVPVVVMVGRK